MFLVAPVRERGLKFPRNPRELLNLQRRSRKGAWIEILCPRPALELAHVAPVRERGLKLNPIMTI